MPSIKSIHNPEDRKHGYSIIIPVYNAQKTLPDTLRSIQGLDYSHYEVIVVDDGSIDESAEIARSYGAKVVSLGNNRGPAYARNQGAIHAVYDRLLFTDSDVLVPKTLLSKLDERFLESNADAVQGTFSVVCPYANYFSQYKNLYNRFVLNRLPDWIDTTFTSITAVRRSAFLDSGGFDSQIRGASVEDRSLGRNLIRHGYRIRLDRSLEVIHNKRLSFTGFMRNQFRRSRDLAKLMLRNRMEKLPASAESVATFDESGRFGTNSLSTMIRIPILYCGLALLIPIPISPAFGALAGLFFSVYLGLISSFELELIKRRGFSFALRGIFVNGLDALISGFGIGMGIVEFFILHRRY